MDIREQLTSDMKDAMRAKDQARLDAIRFLMSEIKKREIELRPAEMPKDEVITVLKKMVKQRKDSIEQYKAGNRQDLVDKESRELSIIESYLPAQLSREQLETLVAEVIAELKAVSIKDMGAVMKAVAAKSGGSADGKTVSEIVRSKLK